MQGELHFTTKFKLPIALSSSSKLLPAGYRIPETQSRSEPTPVGMCPNLS